MLSEVEKQKAIMLGTWKIWSGERRHLAVEILVEEAHKCYNHNNGIIFI